jgi:hypothetical protein
VYVIEREKAVWSVLHNVHLNVSKATITTPNLLVSCLRSETDITAAKDVASVTARFLLYP